MSELYVVKMPFISGALWGMTTITTFEKLRQKYWEFEAIVGHSKFSVILYYTARLSAHKLNK